MKVEMIKISSGLLELFSVPRVALSMLVPKMYQFDPRPLGIRVGVKKLIVWSQKIIPTIGMEF